MKPLIMTMILNKNPVIRKKRSKEMRCKNGSLSSVLMGNIVAAVHPDFREIIPVITTEKLDNSR